MIQDVDKLLNRLVQLFWRLPLQGAIVTDGTVTHQDDVGVAGRAVDTMCRKVVDGDRPRGCMTMQWPVSKMGRGWARWLGACVLSAGLWPGMAAAQVETPSFEPGCVGLVLGGGGARGIAHVGVLKVLERERIPICAISGTSMGAIVGGSVFLGFGTPLGPLFFGYGRNEAGASSFYLTFGSLLRRDGE